MVQETLLGLMVITFTPEKRWRPEHEEWIEKVNAFVNNKQKIADLINFSRSCINQAKAFGASKAVFDSLKGEQQSNDELLKSIEQYFQAIKNNKYDQINQNLLERKIEPLNDILIMLKSQLREKETGTSVAIISQKPRITDLMDYDTTQCCAFMPYYNEEGTMEYIRDDYIGLLQYFVMSGKKPSTIYGVIIFAICEDNNKNTTLLIDSAEGDENMLRMMKNWQETYHECIRGLAKDIKATQIIYGANPGNTVPKEFLKYISQKATLLESPIYLTKKGNLKGEPYLESFKGDAPKGDVDGYIETL